MQFLKKIVVAILMWESRLILRKYKPFVIAVTGSVGKTSTKDAIYAVLRDHSRYVRKSDKSFNSDIGLPLTVIGVPNAWKSLGGWFANIRKGLGLIVTRRPYPDTLILELGADHPGDISSVARWLRPDIAVILKVSRVPVHVEFFRSPEQVFQEKASLARSVKKGGTVVLYADDDKTLSLRPELESKGITVTTFGLTETATAHGSQIETVYEAGLPAGLSFTLYVGAQSSKVVLHGMLGTTHIYPLLAAAAVAQARDIPLAMTAKAIEKHVAPKGRMHVLRGIGGSVIIDDTYNSSPDAVVSALETLRGVQTTGAKIAVLGDMMELGKYAAEEHRNIGKRAAGVVSRLITVGPRSRATADAALKAGMNAGSVESYDVSASVGEKLVASVKAGDIILVKGSQSMRMERVVAALLADPADAPKYLVRQERQWLEKK